MVQIRQDNIFPIAKEAAKLNRGCLPPIHRGYKEHPIRKQSRLLLSSCLHHIIRGLLSAQQWPSREEVGQTIQIEQLSRNPGSSLQLSRDVDVVNLDSKATANASPDEQLRGDQNNHTFTGKCLSVRQGQAKFVTGSNSESISEPSAADGSLLIENLSSATERPREKQAGSARRICLILAGDALSLFASQRASIRRWNTTCR